MTTINDTQTHIRALLAGMRGGIDPIQTLDYLTSIIDASELGRATAAHEARRQKMTWSQIGHASGMTKQAAQQRWGRTEPEAVDPGPSLFDQ